MFLQKLKKFDFESKLPINFGLVMATGIISIAAHLLNHQWLSRFLFDLNVIFYVTLWCVTIWTVCRYPRSFLRGISDYVNGPTFFTVVAATSIVGSQFVILDSNHQLANYLWILAVFLWAMLTYVFFATIAIKSNKPTVELGLNGSWLLTIVAAESLTVLGSFLLAQNSPLNASAMVFLLLVIWLSGGLLYLLVMTIIFYRIIFRNFSPEDFSPSYWINMGAMAISTLAGTRLIIAAHDSPLMLSILPFVKGVTLLFWTAGTWWIPFLILLEIWRHLYKRYPLNYSPIYWGLIFPLGMYAASTYELIQVFDLNFLSTIPHTFLYLALLTWGLACIGAIQKTWKLFTHQS